MVVNLCLKRKKRRKNIKQKKTHIVVNLCLKRKRKTKNKNKNKKQKNSHGGESLFEKRLGRRPLDRELLPLLLTLLSRGDRQTKVSNLRPPKLVQQNISDKMVGKGWNRLWHMLELSDYLPGRQISVDNVEALQPLHSTGDLDLPGEQLAPQFWNLLHFSRTFPPFLQVILQVTLLHELLDH